MNLTRDIPNLENIFINSKGGQMAKPMIILAIILLLTTACGISREDLSTLGPDIELGGSNTDGENLDVTPVVDESPRNAAEIEVPPTWTPGAVVDSLVPVQPAPVSTVDSTVDSTTENASESLTYEVQPGDTLAEIAIQFNVTLDDIAAANGIENLDHIEVGQILVIPG